MSDELSAPGGRTAPPRDAAGENEDRYRRLVEHASDAVWIFDLSRERFVYASPSVSRLGGWSADELLAAPLDAILAPESLRKVRRLLAAGSAATEAGDEPGWNEVVEVEMLDRDGGRLAVEVATSFAVDVRTGARYLHGAARDVRRRRIAETTRLQALERDLQSRRVESVVRLAGGIAHEFNNLLAVIQGFSSLGLEQAEPESPAHEGLRAIHSASLRAAGLVRQLLAYAQRAPGAPRAVDLNVALSLVAARFALRQPNDAVLRFSPTPGLGLVHIDPVQLDEVVDALLANAREALSAKGRIDIETRNATLDDEFCNRHPGAVPGRYVLLTVRDDGRGMPPSVLANAFEPFFTTKTVGNGSGLGLPTAYGLIKQNRGYIDLESAPGAGTRVRVFLPRMAEPDGGRDGAAERVSGEALPPKKTVLLVDDEPAVVRVGARLLSRLGYEVLAADGPEAALIVSGRHEGEIDALVTDIVMPGMNGRELADRLLASRPRMACLFISGFSASVLSTQGVLDPGTRLLAKPFSLEELAEALRDCLRDAPPPAREPG